MSPYTITLLNPRHKYLNTSLVQDISNDFHSQVEWELDGLDCCRPESDLLTTLLLSLMPITLWLTTLLLTTLCLTTCSCCLHLHHVYIVSFIYEFVRQLRNGDGTQRCLYINLLVNISKHFYATCITFSWLAIGRGLRVISVLSSLASSKVFRGYGFKPTPDDLGKCRRIDYQLGASSPVFWNNRTWL